jgi:hypothetical protein
MKGLVASRARTATSCSPAGMRANGITPFSPFVTMAMNTRVFGALA